jgi:hypothetical protein
MIENKIRRWRYWSPLHYVITEADWWLNHIWFKQCSENYQQHIGNDHNWPIEPILLQKFKMIICINVVLQKISVKKCIVERWKFWIQVKAFWIFKLWIVHTIAKFLGIVYLPHVFFKVLTKGSSKDFLLEIFSILLEWIIHVDLFFVKFLPHFPNNHAHIFSQ